MTVGIIGLGLIGGSIGLALRDPDRKVIGYDPDEKACDMALVRHCVDGISGLAEVSASDVVFVAAPPKAVPEVLADVFSMKSPETAVTDCASVKGEIVDWVSERGEQNFVGGHPMAGHEKSGAAYASGWMFRSSRWLLTPTKHTSKEAIARVEQLVKMTGATPVHVSAEEHDHHVAVLSHLPHVLAAILVDLAKDLERTDASGGSWKDLTRVAGVDSGLWTQILIANRKEVIKAIQSTEDDLSHVRKSLESADEDSIRRFFEEAKRRKVRQG